MLFFVFTFFVFSQSLYAMDWEITTENRYQKNKEEFILEKFDYYIDELNEVDKTINIILSDASKKLNKSPKTAVIISAEETFLQTVGTKRNKTYEYLFNPGFLNHLNWIESLKYGEDFSEEFESSHINTVDHRSFKFMEENIKETLKKKCLTLDFLGVVSFFPEAESLLKTLEVKYFIDDTNTLIKSDILNPTIMIPRILRKEKVENLDLIIFIGSQSTASNDFFPLSKYDFFGIGNSKLHLVSIKNKYFKNLLKKNKSDVELELEEWLSHCSPDNSNSGSSEEYSDDSDEEIDDKPTNRLDWLFHHTQ